MPSPCSLCKGRCQMFGSRVRGSMKETGPRCRCGCQGLGKDPSSTVILNACRVANGLCWLKKRKANTNLKTWKSPQELRAILGWPGVGGDGPDGVCTANGLCYRRLAVHGVSSQFCCCSSPKRADQRERGKLGIDGHAGSEAAGWVQISPRRFL